MSCQGREAGGQGVVWGRGKVMWRDVTRRVAGGQGVAMLWRVLRAAWGQVVDMLVGGDREGLRWIRGAWRLSGVEGRSEIERGLRGLCRVVKGRRGGDPGVT